MVSKVKNVIKNVMNELENSIQPSIAELERLFIFMNKEFNLKLPDNVVVNIQQTNKNTKGFFRPLGHLEHFENHDKPLHTIVVSSHYLKDTPYETFAHEMTHLINEVKGIKDCTKNQYHNKHFKEVAEMLHLKVEKMGNRGYALTSETPEFQKMLDKFKPNKDAFCLFQNQKPKGKSPNRNLLFVCECGVKVRTARNTDRPFQAICQYCNTEFKAQ